MSLFEVKMRTRSAADISRSRSRRAPEPRPYRLYILGLFFVFFAGLVGARLVKLQFVDASYYTALASDQYEIFRNIYPERGKIYLTEKSLGGGETTTPVAVNRELTLVYAVPKEITDPEAVLNALIDTLDFSEDIRSLRKEVTVEMSAEMTEEKLKQEKEKLEKMADQDAADLFKKNLLANLGKKNDPYEPIRHRVNDEAVAKLKNYHLSGLGFAAETSRFYPEKTLASHVLGFVGHASDNNLLKGYYGLEGYYDKILAGSMGFSRTESDVSGQWIALGGSDTKGAVSGADLVLTIDKSLEYYVCNEIRYGVENFAADQGSIIVMNPNTGAILAMCSFPDFDPNEYNKIKEVKVFKNSPLLDAYEPGSVFKALTMAAAINTGKVTPFTTYTDTGEIRLYDRVIKNFDNKAYGLMTMTGVLENSLNTGAIFAARATGKEAFSSYVKNFGFGVATGLDLGPEGGGNVAPIDKKGELYMCTASFGQGITATPLQLIRAYSALVNGGNLFAPYIVDRVIYPGGKVVKTEPKIVNQVISAETSKQVASMLVSVVQNGHSQKAQVPGYLVGGKTGTAQVPDPVHGGYSAETIHTFIGFAPLEKPAFVILVKLDNVKKTQYADGSTVPIFNKIAKFILNYYGIPPTVK
jgi:cell division protein FtsI/penicillin-binding protein 2